MWLDLEEEESHRENAAGDPEKTQGRTAWGRRQRLERRVYKTRNPGLLVMTRDWKREEGFPPGEHSPASTLIADRQPPGP